MSRFKGLKMSTVILNVLFALMMIVAGVLHLVKPAVYLPIVLPFIPFAMAVIYISGIVEIVLGVLLLMNRKYAKLGALGLLVLMILFLPLHILDAFSEHPAIGSHTVAYVRILVQFVIIALAWKLYKVLSKK